MGGSVTSILGDSDGNAENVGGGVEDFLDDDFFDPDFLEDAFFDPDLFDPDFLEGSAG